MDFQRAYGPLTPELARDIDAAFDYQPWNEEQKAAGKAVREALAAAFKVIVREVPPGPDRTVALRKLREARMDCNSAITFGGRL
jgi:hypothetical protein